MRVHVVYKDGATANLESAAANMTVLMSDLNRDQFTDFTVQVPIDENTYKRHVLLVNRDDIAQVREGWKGVQA